MNIHVNKTAGGAWISGITGCEVKMSEEPGVPDKEIVLEWWPEVSKAQGF